jgi:hypothetical protein
MTTRSGRKPGKALGGTEFNIQAHREAHLPRIMVYSSKATLSTTASSPIYPPRGGRIAAVHGNVTGTGASDTTIDVLIGGSSIFPAAAGYPTIVAGQMSTGLSGGDLFDEPRIPGDPDALFRAFEKVQIQLIATGGATGPIHVQMEVDWDD